mmetsp:Transcript_86385/g.259169  ORF Transcript_86385/g.259169 Transcript_86385/m.259169 type:complete len:429 (-) Transcript_86385:121-1407(-)
MCGAGSCSSGWGIDGGPVRYAARPSEMEPPSSPHALREGSPAAAVHLPCLLATPRHPPSPPPLRRDAPAHVALALANVHMYSTMAINDVLQASGSLAGGGDKGEDGEVCSGAPSVDKIADQRSLIGALPLVKTHIAVTVLLVLLNHPGQAGLGGSDRKVPPLAARRLCFARDPTTAGELFVLRAAATHHGWVGEGPAWKPHVKVVEKGAIRLKHCRYVGVAYPAEEGVHLTLVEVICLDEDEARAQALPREAREHVWLSSLDVDRDQVDVRRLEFGFGNLVEHADASPGLHRRHCPHLCAIAFALARLASLVVKRRAVAALCRHHDLRAATHHTLGHELARALPFNCGVVLFLRLEADAFPSETQVEEGGVADCEGLVGADVEVDAALLAGEEVTVKHPILPCLRPAASGLAAQQVLAALTMLRLDAG